MTSEDRYNIGLHEERTSVNVVAKTLLAITTNETKLILYALYKQAILGPCRKYPEKDASDANEAHSFSRLVQASSQGGENEICDCGMPTASAHHEYDRRARPRHHDWLGFALRVLSLFTFTTDLSTRVSRSRQGIFGPHSRNPRLSLTIRRLRRSAEDEANGGRTSLAAGLE
ncbi:Acyl-CoA-binding domain-containing protein 2 [Asimina triloba]